MTFWDVMVAIASQHANSARYRAFADGLGDLELAVSQILPRLQKADTQ